MRRTLMLLPFLWAALCSRAQVQPDMYWPLDESVGNIAHAVAGGSDGVVSGVTEWQPTGGHHGGALRCNGNDARVDLGTCSFTTGTGQAFSIACWFKAEVVSGTERVLLAKASGNEYAWSLSLINSTGARFRLRTGGVTHVLEIPSSTLFSGAWYHLAGVYDGTQMLFYLNGSLTAWASISGSMDSADQGTATLGNIPGNGLPFYGSLDDVRIYNTALSQMDVIDLVIGNVSTAIVEPVITCDNNDMLHLPEGNWTDLDVWDAMGRSVEHRALTTQQGLTPLGNMRSGAYIVRLRDRERAISGRLVKL